MTEERDLLKLFDPTNSLDTPDLLDLVTRIGRDLDSYRDLLSDAGLSGELQEHMQRCRVVREELRSWAPARPMR